VQLAAPFFDDFLLYPEPDNLDRIRLRWRHKKSEENWDISQLSDGTLRFICLSTLLLQPNSPDLIIIDEPELGLHPAAMELLVEMIRSVATKSQVIISTQAVSMVNQFAPEEIIVVEREKDESVFNRKNSKELEMWLDEYSMGELWEMNVIGGRP
jgi:predicted ATPase